MEIREGLSVGGEPMYASPEIVSAAPQADPPPTDPATDTAEEIGAALLTPGTSDTDVRSGITETLPPEPDSAPDPLSPESERALEQARRDLAVEASEAEAGRQALEVLAIQEFEVAAERAENEGQLASALASLRGRIPDGDFDEILDRVSGQWLGLVDEDAEDEEVGQEWADFMDRLDRHANSIEALRAAVQSREELERLLPVAAEQRARDVGETVRAWAKDQGFTSDREAKLRFDAAQDFAERELGISLERIAADPSGFDQKAFDAVLRSADAALVEGSKGEQNRRAQQAILDSSSTNVADGIERFTAFGWQRVNGHELPRKPVEADRVVARAQAHRASARSIRESISEPESKNIADGLVATVKGKRARLSDVFKAPDPARSPRGGIGF